MRAKDASSSGKPPIKNDFWDTSIDWYPETDSCARKRFRENAVVAGAEGPNDGVFTFREAQAVSDIGSEVA